MHIRWPVTRSTRVSQRCCRRLQPATDTMAHCGLLESQWCIERPQLRAGTESVTDAEHGSSPLHVVPSVRDSLFGWSVRSSATTCRDRVNRLRSLQFSSSNQKRQRQDRGGWMFGPFRAYTSALPPIAIADMRLSEASAHDQVNRNARQVSK